MGTRISIATAALGLTAALLALMLAAATPALAHHKGGHEGGPRGGETAGSGEADDGDNRHPSGKDRSVEPGGSGTSGGGTQGKSESHPDDSKGPQRYEGNRGADKPGGPGGTDLADQDGNNGCGNDDDFDDDNNGWCGKPKTAPDEAPVPPAGTSVPRPDEGDDKAPDNDADGVGGDSEDRPDADVLSGVETRPLSGPRVLGSRLKGAPEVASAREATAPGGAGAVLPFTGANVLELAALGLALVVSGAVVARSRN